MNIFHNPISILLRRTADVRAVGYAELFVLSREDILKALKDHPDAEAVIRKHATRRLCETRVRQQAHLHGKKSPILSNNLCKPLISSGVHENTSVKLEVPSSGTIRNLSMLFNNENDSQSQQTTINSGILAQWKSRHIGGKILLSLYSEFHCTYYLLTPVTPRQGA
ncbi:unnamed protein product [Schistosoma mattheei]|uniref:Uncharacterized protein n=1 Tax=Schistosoma mattheei TaxID=31246 RepID=A0A183PX23_9TREM|nr:unnamed protein product [Schistosoma mattheei]